MWIKYRDLEPVRRLRCEGRELLGKDVYVTEKRDGSNISLWINDANIVCISSHNLEVADENLTDLMKSTPEYPKIRNFLSEEKNKYRHSYIAYGELVSGKGATRIERVKKTPHWVLFDILNVEDNRFLGYNLIYQHAYHWKIPVVKALAIVALSSMEELNAEIEKWLKWCRKHSREGIVLKVFNGNQDFAKEKIDLPKLERVKSDDDKIQLPPMPEDRILRGLQHAFDVVGEENWKDVKVAMPEVAKQIEIEAREHLFQVPRNLYKLYTDTPLTLMKVGKVV